MNKSNKIRFNSKIKCFIAIAFGRDDTDQIYDSVIEPSLRKLSIDAIRVDRKEHNKNIDDVIIDELSKCDFVIADLTYSRPSVYYEAGYAERCIPVIYTCRNDHLKPKEDDLFGNLRIHFDLLMKNIIDWSKPSDKMFQKKLLSRIRHVLNPIKQERDKYIKEMSEINEFRALAEIDKISLIQSISETILKKCGFVRSYKEYTVLSSFSKRLLSMINTKKKNSFVFILTLPKLMGNDLMPILTIIDEIIKNTSADTSIGKSIIRAKQLKKIIIISSPNSLRFSTIKRNLPFAKIGNFDNELVWTSNFGFRQNIKRDLINISTETHLHIFNSIKSGNSYKQDLENRMDRN